MFILPFGGACLNILRNRLFKGTLSDSILTTVDSRKRVLHILG